MICTQGSLLQSCMFHYECVICRRGISRPIPWDCDETYIGRVWYIKSFNLLLLHDHQSRFGKRLFCELSHFKNTDLAGKNWVNYDKSKIATNSVNLISFSSFWQVLHDITRLFTYYIHILHQLQAMKMKFWSYF